MHMQNDETTNNKFLPLTVLISGVLIAGAVIWSGSHSATAPAAAALAGAGAAGAKAPVALTAEAKAVAADVKANKATYQAMVDSDKAEAGKAGINATPGFVLGKELILGAVPYASFQTAIDNVIAGRPAVAIPSDGLAISKVDSKDLAAAADPIMGKADAPVTIVFWSDFQCPFCKSFELNTLPQIVKDYVDTGKVKIVMMDFTFLGNDSVTAALYNRSVWKLFPDKYFAWRTAMYTAQDQEGDQGFGNADSIDQLDSTVLN